MFVCEMCGEGVIWGFLTAGSNNIMSVGGDLDRANFLFTEQWPLAQAGAAPADTPSNAANFFEQGTSSLEAGNYDAAGMMFRKTVESATKELDQSSTKHSLVKRIDELAKVGKLTEDLASWAHEARLGGNEAAHDDEPFSQADAEDLKNFVENFLRYTFSLPSAVKRREGRA